MPFRRKIKQGTAWAETFVSWFHAPEKGQKKSRSKSGIHESVLAAYSP